MALIFLWFLFTFTYSGFAVFFTGQFLAPVPILFSWLLSSPMCRNVTKISNGYKKKKEWRRNCSCQMLPFSPVKSEEVNKHQVHDQIFWANVYNLTQEIGRTKHKQTWGTEKGKKKKRAEWKRFTYAKQVKGSRAAVVAECSICCWKTENL